MDITQFRSLPAELRKGTRFICWRAQEVRAGEWARVPVDAHDGGLAKVDDPNTWTEWNMALDYYSSRQNFLSGIARVLAPTDSPTMTAITFTNCTDERGRLKRGHLAFHWAGQLDTYSELSPDATAVTSWAYADHLLGGEMQRTKDLGDGSAIMICRSHQWLPLTGRRLTDYDGIVRNRRSTVNDLYQALFAEEDERNRKPDLPLRRQSRFASRPSPSLSPLPPPRPAYASATATKTGVSKLDIAIDFLREKLRHGDMECLRILAAAEDRGISSGTLLRAKKALGVESYPKWFGGPIYWTLHPERRRKR